MTTDEDDGSVAVANAQRYLDRLPRPPCEYPVGSPERMAHDLIETARAGEGLREDLREEIDSLENELETNRKDGTRVDELHGALRCFHEDLLAACSAAEETDTDATPEQRLATLVRRVREIASEIDDENKESR